MWASTTSRVGLLLCLTTAMPAQDADRTPVLLLQPGLVTTDFISSPTATSSTTGFNFRFSTLLPTGRRWFTPIFGVNIVPYGTTGYATKETNTPSVFIGNVFPLISPGRFGGWLRVDAPLLWYYVYDGGGPHNQRLFGRDLYAELSLRSSVGARLLSDLGPNWNRLEAYLLLDQNLTPNPDRISSRTDRFNPIALFGMTVRFGRQQ